MAKANIYEVEGRTFELVTVCVAGLGGCMAETYVYEVIRPNWKFFRTRSVDSKTFWVDEYASIKDGEMEMLARILLREKEEKERREKWEAFSK